MDTPLVLQHLAGAERQLRVAVVTETYPPEVNGVAMTTGRLVDGMLRLGHQVQLVRPRQGETDHPGSSAGFEEVLSRGLPIPRYKHLKMGLPARAVLQRMWAVRRPDVVQVVTEGPLGWSAVTAARRLRLPVVTEFHTNFHSYSSYYGMGWLKQPVEAWLRRFHNKGDLCLAPTAELAGQLMARGMRRVEVVARGVDTRLFSPARRSAELRESWGAAPHTLVAIVVGRMAPEKNLGLAVRAFDRLKAQLGGDARLVLVGDGPARAALQAERPDLCYAGMRTGEDLAAHYASADLFLFPSTTETFGNVVTEALASGLPVVGYDYAAAAEHVRDGHNGCLAPLGDEAAFVAAALRMGSAALRAQLAGKARDSVLSVDWDAVTRSLAGLLGEVVLAHERRNAPDARTATA